MHAAWARPLTSHLTCLTSLPSSPHPSPHLPSHPRPQQHLLAGREAPWPGRKSWAALSTCPELRASDHLPPGKSGSRTLASGIRAQVSLWSVELMALGLIVPTACLELKGDLLPPSEWDNL